MDESVTTRRDFLLRTALYGTTCLAAAGTGRAHSETPSVRVRKSIDAFAQDKKAVKDFRKAVKKMRELDPEHPFSWIFQANIHWRPFYPDYVYKQAEKSKDPAVRLFRDKTGFVPVSPEQDVFNQCPHGNWWFLPWHRAYLYYFERALQWASGNPAFALPYWNYSDPNQRELPDLFREPTVNNGGAKEPNPLYLPDSVTFTNEQGQMEVFPMRDGPLNQGLSQLTGSAVDVTAALAKRVFATSSPAPSGEGFGSPRACGLTCSCGSGALESTPHNKVHNAIGGSAVMVGRSLRVGFMGDVATAARDPVFWPHHANIDRLWESWLKGGGQRANPTDPEWLDQQFIFYDYDEDKPQEKPFQVRPSPRDLLSTQDLGYKYDHLEQMPTAVAKRAVFLIGAGPPQDLAETGKPKKARSIPRVRPHAMPIESLPDEGTAIQLKPDSRAAVRIPLAVRMTPERLREAARRKDEGTGGLVLALDGIEFVRTPGVYYDVYLGSAKEKDNLTPESPYFVGSLTFFGLKHPPGTGHGGHGAPLSQRFLLPERLRQIIERGELDLTKLEVTFVPHTGTEAIPGKKAERPKPPDRVVVTVRQIRIIRSR